MRNEVKEMRNEVKEMRNVKFFIEPVKREIAVKVIYNTLYVNGFKFNFEEVNQAVRALNFRSFYNANQVVIDDMYSAEFILFEDTTIGVYAKVADNTLTMERVEPYFGLLFLDQIKTFKELKGLASYINDSLNLDAEEPKYLKKSGIVTLYYKNVIFYFYKDRVEFFENFTYQSTFNYEGHTKFDLLNEVAEFLDNFCYYCELYIDGQWKYVYVFDDLVFDKFGDYVGEYHWYEGYSNLHTIDQGEVAVHDNQKMEKGIAVKIGDNYDFYEEVYKLEDRYVVYDEGSGNYFTIFKGENGYIDLDECGTVYINETEKHILVDMLRFRFGFTVISDLDPSLNDCDPELDLNDCNYKLKIYGTHISAIYEDMKIKYDDLHFYYIDYDTLAEMVDEIKRYVEV